MMSTLLTLRLTTLNKICHVFPPVSIERVHREAPMRWRYGHIIRPGKMYNISEKKTYSDAALPCGDLVQIPDITYISAIIHSGKALNAHRRSLV